MKVLMVCLGNICRSPLAHGLLREKAKNLGWEVDSAGTAAYHAGDAPDPRTILIAKKNGLNIKDLVARKFDESDFDHYDKIYAMDQSNYRNILALARNEEDKSKVEMILNELNPGADDEVPDPYYGGEHGFVHMYNLLDEATDQIINKYG